jgi:hypothetical protein
MKIEPGVYPGIPMDVYVTWDAANYSVLKKFDRSAAHAREMLTNPPDQTPAMALGTATHAAVLEPELFKSGWAVGPEGDKRTKKTKLAWAKFEAENPDKEAQTANEYAQCSAMAQAAHANPNVLELIKGKGFTELSFVWVDQATDVLCKGRIDRFGRLWGNNVIADLKTTTNASEEAWKWEVRKYFYHAQAAFYIDGLDKLSPSVNRKFIWIALEKEPPFGVALYEPDEATIDKGRRIYRKYLRQWKHCHATGIWPGYNEGVQSLMLPDWALRHEDGEESESL